MYDNSLTFYMPCIFESSTMNPTIPSYNIKAAAPANTTSAEPSTPNLAAAPVDAVTGADPLIEAEAPDPEVLLADGADPLAVFNPLDALAAELTGAPVAVAAPPLNKLAPSTTVAEINEISLPVKVAVTGPLVSSLPPP